MGHKSDETSKFYASLIENLPEGIIIHDLESVKFVNNTLTRITGYTKEELLSMNPNEFLIEERKQ